MKYIFESFQKNFLNEANETFDVKLKQIKKRNPGYDDRLFYRLVEIDPTTNRDKQVVGKYIDWLIRKVSSFEQADSVRVPLEWYADGIKKNILQKQFNISPDINSFKTIDEFINTLRGIMKTLDDSVQSESEYNARKKYEGEFIIRGESKYWEIISPTTWEAERYFGRHTEWRTVGQKGYFESYGGPEGKLNILYPKFCVMKTDDDYKKRIQFDFYKNSHSPFFATDDNGFKKLSVALLNCNVEIDEVYIEDAVALVNKLFNRDEKYIKIEDIQKLLDNGIDASQIFDRIDTRYSDIYGLCIVRVNEKYNILKNNKILCKKCFDWVYDFQNGFARVQQNGKWGIINTEGNLLGDGCVYDWVGDFENGLAQVQQNDKWGFINKEGKPLGDGCVYDGTYDFQNGFARVIQNGQWGFINTEGNPLGDGCVYDWVGDFENGLARVKQNDKWGFINKEGNPLGDGCVYDGVWNFQNGFAQVKQNGKRGFINKEGKWFDSIPR